MNIIVHLHTTLQRQTATGLINRLEVVLPPEGTLADLVANLAFELDLENTLVVVNGHRIEPAQPLADGDQVHLIPAISGG